MRESEPFELTAFLPYLLNQAAETVSRQFQAVYQAEFGLSRPQWRVLANLGQSGAMTARDICRITHEEKSQVSRAVAGLSARGLLTRQPDDRDGRAGILALTPAGAALYAELGQRALICDQGLRAGLGPGVADLLEAALRQLAARG